MWSFVKRLWNIMVGNLNSAADKFEKPINMTKQGIRDLELTLAESLKSFAEVRATAIRSKNDVKKAEQTANDYKRKAMGLLHKAQKGFSPAESERLAAEAMAQREQQLQLYKTHLAHQVKYDAMTTNIENKIKQLKSNIAKWKNELKSLEARQKASLASLKINKKMSGLDSNKTLEMLNKLRERVESEEALSDAYGEMANINKSIDDEINTALGNHQGIGALQALKEEMNLQKKVIKIQKKESIQIEIEIESNNTDFI